MPITSRDVANPTLTIDLISLLHGVGLSNKEINAFTPIIKKKKVREEIGDRVINKIIDTTLSGYDKDGKKFQGYSKSYKNSTVFKIWKGGKRNPDLKLTGQMHADMSVVGGSSSTVTIGFPDNEQANKAKGHITGANYLPRRDFFGIKEEDLHKIMLDVITEYEDEAFITQREILENIPVPVGVEDNQFLFLGE